MQLPTPARRPAETGGVALALAVLVARAFGIDDVDTITYMAIVVGAAPAAITWLVELFHRPRAAAEDGDITIRTVLVVVAALIAIVVLLGVGDLDGVKALAVAILILAVAFFAP